uniref:Uncharacterized protein n=1 Tax=Daphnia galeata TaxID=27404 RepID=A0A8J2RMY4_9CRUS|nr:unnamed protein product [Daphnia galeata]
MATASTGSTNMSIENSSGSSTAEECGAHVKIEEDFLNSGRTGRRNAIPDIYCPQSRVSTAELPTNFARLSCEGTLFINFSSSLAKPKCHQALIWGPTPDRMTPISSDTHSFCKK